MSHCYSHQHEKGENHSNDLSEEEEEFKEFDEEIISSSSSFFDSSTTPIFVLERLSNIKRLQLTLSLPSNYLDKPLISVKDGILLIDFGSKGKLSAKTCSLLDNSPFLESSFVSGRSLDLKMAIAADLHVQNEEEDGNLLKVSDLSHLYCKRCVNPLLRKSEGGENVVKRVLSMPSPYWLEMSDMWICGCCNSTFDQFPIGEVSAIASACLVGDNYVMLHKNDIELGAIQLNNQKTVLIMAGTKFETLWASVECSSCGIQIGIAQTEDLGSANLQNTLNYRFYKHLISNEHEIDRNTFRWNTSETVVAADIFSASQAHKVYRFFVREIEGNRIVMQIWLTNWDTCISTNIHNPNQTETFGMFPVLRIFYRTFGSQNKSSKQQIQAWRDKFTVEILSYPLENCLQLVKLLDSSNLSYPTDRRIFSGMKIGYLKML